MIIRIKNEDLDYQEIRGRAKDLWKQEQVFFLEFSHHLNLCLNTLKIQTLLLMLPHTNPF